MNPALEETIYCDFITSSPTTGAASDADSTPTCEVFEDSTDTAILSPTVTKRTGKTGDYRIPIACTAANGFETAKSYNVVVSATVGAVAAKAVIRTFQMRTRDVDDVSTYAGADTAGTTTLLTRLPSALTVTAGAVNVNDKTGFALTAAYDAAKTAASQVSVNTIDGRLDTEIPAIKTSTDNLATAMELDGGVYRFTVNALENAPAGGGGGTTDWTAPEREQIRHRLGIDGTATAPSTGNPSLPDAADISQINTKLDAISTGLPLDATELNAIADALLKRDWTAITGEASYSVLQALRMLRNVWNTTGGTLSVKKEDGTTNAWTRTLSTDPAAEPITGAA